MYSEKQIFVSKDKGNTWEDLSPQHEGLIKINDVTLGRDLHLYINTIETSVLKSEETLTRIKDQEFIGYIDIYPNPTTGIIYIDSKELNITTAKVISTTGQVLTTLDIENNQIFIESSPGIYFLDLTTNDGLRGIQKIVVVD